MSYSELFAVEKSGDVKGVKEYRNGHGYAMPIWNWLFEKYIKPTNPGKYVYVLSDEGKPIFALHDDPRLEDWERVCLWASFDYAVVDKGNVPKLVKAFRTFHDNYKGQYPQNVCHYAEMAGDIENIIKEGADGVAFWATSVACCEWTVQDECECKTCGDVHMKDEYRPYNVTTGEKHFLMFEKMKNAIA